MGHWVVFLNASSQYHIKQDAHINTGETTFVHFDAPCIQQFVLLQRWLGNDVVPDNDCKHIFLWSFEAILKLQYINL
jgi:hypothetical protein